MRKIAFVLLSSAAFLLSSCGGSSDKAVTSDTTKVTVDTIKKIDTTKVATVKAEISTVGTSPVVKK